MVNDEIVERALDVLSQGMMDWRKSPFAPNWRANMRAALEAAGIGAGSIARPVVFIVEGSEHLIRLSLGGVELCAHRDGTPQAIALLELDAEQHPLTSSPAQIREDRHHGE